MASVLGVIVIAFLIYYVLLGIHRIIFHRVAHIPGPFLARLTYLYEFYFDVVLGGQYIWEIRAMHEKYGPIVRINPEEIHIQDAEYFDEIFSGPGRKRNKEVSVDLNLSQSVFMTRDHDLHRIRRAALAPYFSIKNVRQLQPRIASVIKNLLRRLEECRVLKIPLPASTAYTALTNDIITEYAFARCKDKLSAPRLEANFADTDRTGARLRHLVKHCRWLFVVMKLLPADLLGRLVSEIGVKRRLQKDVHTQVADIYDQYRHAGNQDSKAGITIFHDILRSNLPEHEKLPPRLGHDGWAIVVAGTLTTATALSETTFHLLRNPEALRRVKEEIMLVMPDPEMMPSLANAQRLPFLQAVVNEGLRLNSGASMRLPRTAMQETLEYVARVPGKNGKMEDKIYIIPPSTTVCMTPLLIHHSPKYFDNPATFNPQRWLDHPDLERYFMPFSRGSRQCIAMNLALAEIFLTLAAIFRTYGSRDVRFPEDVGYLELDKTTPEDMEIMGDALTPFYRTTRGLWIRVRDHEEA